MAEYIVEARPSDLFGIKMTGLIVRCRDCNKYGDNKKCPIEALINSDSKQFFAFDENWFCADGERK